MNETLAQKLASLPPDQQAEAYAALDTIRRLLGVDVVWELGVDEVRHGEGE